MKEAYLKHCDERKVENLPPLALNAKQTKSVVDQLIVGSDDVFFLDLLTHRVPPGVDEAAYVKAGFLNSVAKGEQACKAISQKHATFLLGTMLGGYSITSLIELLDIDETAERLAKPFLTPYLSMKAHQIILEKSTHNTYAKKIVDSWAEGIGLPQKIHFLKVLKQSFFG